MPRPKVKASERKRVSQACLPCKASKKKCDGALPCRHCLWRREAGSCRYAQGRPSDGQPTSPQPSSQDLSRSQITVTTPSTNVENSVAAARLLWTSKGEQVYVGSSASLTFLHVLRKIFARSMGPSEFTTDLRQDFMLEKQRHTFDQASFACQHTVEQNLELMNHYLTATCGIFDILTDTEIADSVTTDYSDEFNQLRKACLHSILAIGAQTRASGADDERCEAHHFAEAQTIAIATMLEDPSLDMVRAFLLLGFYLLGACRRNGAFMYIGIAARAAYALGIHEVQVQTTSDLERDSQLAIWKSVRVLDLVVATALGRPSATRVHGNIRRPIGQGNHRRIALDANSDVWNINDKVVNTLYHQSSPNEADVSSLLNALETWSSNLDSSLKSQSASSSTADNRAVIGNMHVACSYYFGVMLATRGLLITDLTSKISADSPVEVVAMRKPAPGTRGTITAYSQTCIDAAVLTLQTCYEVYTAKAMLNNMCLIKVWVFTASMVLGFALFSKEEPDTELGAAFQKGQAVLSHLSSHSVQAQRYLDILTDLRAAINAHLAQNSLPDNHRKSFVSKIFSMQPPANQTMHMHNNNFQSDQGLTSHSSEQSQSTGELGKAPEPSDDFMDTFGVALNDMDSVALNLWDNFVSVPGMYFAD